MGHNMELYDEKEAKHITNNTIDQWLAEIANTIGRLVFLENVIWEHMHYLAEKAEWDETYGFASANDYAIPHADQEMYNHPSMIEERKRLATLLEEAKGQTKHTHCPPLGRYCPGSGHHEG